MSVQRGRLAVGAILAVLLLAVVFRGTDWEALGQALRDARPAPLLALVLVTVVTYALRAWRWGLLLAPLGRVRYRDLFSATYVGFASGLLIPRAQEIMRPWLISRRYPIPLSAGFATVILERLVDLITVLVLFGLLRDSDTHPDSFLGRAVPRTLLGRAVAGMARPQLSEPHATHDGTEEAGGSKRNPESARATVPGVEPVVRSRQALHPARL